MSLLTVEQMREHVETDLSDTEVQRLIDAAEEEIIDKYGPHATQTDELDECRLSNVLFLTRPASEITTVTEEIHTNGSIEQTPLDPDDYDLTADGWRIRRLTTGTNPRGTWGDVVIVQYTPKDETSKREGVLIDLVKLAAQFSGLDSEKTGDYQSSQKDYQKSRNQVLGRLSRRMFA